MNYTDYCWIYPEGYNIQRVLKNMETLGSKFCSEYNGEYTWKFQFEK